MRGMAEAVKLMHDLKIKKEKETEQSKAAEKEAERQRKSWTNPSNYKFW